MPGRPRKCQLRRGLTLSRRASACGPQRLGRKALTQTSTVHCQCTLVRGLTRQDSSGSPQTPLRFPAQLSEFQFRFPLRSQGHQEQSQAPSPAFWLQSPHSAWPFCDTTNNLGFREGNGWIYLFASDPDGPCTWRSLNTTNSNFQLYQKYPF